jgi:hypothetical protein
VDGASISPDTVRDRGHFFQLEFGQEQNLKLADFRGGKKLLIARAICPCCSSTLSAARRLKASGVVKKSFIINRLRVHIGGEFPVAFFHRRRKKDAIGDFRLDPAADPRRFPTAAGR